MNIPTQLQYTKTHEWVLFTSENEAKVGLTDFAQESLGSLVFVNLPEEGDPLTAGESFADVESVKAVSDVMAPFDGTVSAINEALLDMPEMINESPYEAWLVQVSNISAQEAFMDAAAYKAFCEETN